MRLEDFKKDSIWNYYIENPSVTISIEREKDFYVKGIGVYVFLDKDMNALCVGFSRVLNTRISMHFVAAGLMKLMPEAKFIQIYFNKDMGFEKELIRKYNPKYNNTGVVATCNKKTTNDEYKAFNNGHI